MLSAKSTDLEISSTKKHRRSLSIVLDGYRSNSSNSNPPTDNSSNSNSNSSSHSSNNRQSRSFSVGMVHAGSALPVSNNNPQPSPVASAALPLATRFSVTGSNQGTAPEMNVSQQVDSGRQSEEHLSRTRIAGSWVLTTSAAASAAIPPVIAEEDAAAGATVAANLSDALVSASPSSFFSPNPSSSFTCTVLSSVSSSTSLATSSSSTSPTSDHPSTPASLLAKPQPLPPLFSTADSLPISPFSSCDHSSFHSTAHSSPQTAPAPSLSPSTLVHLQPIASMTTLPPLPLMSHTPLFTNECLESITGFSSSSSSSSSSSAMTSPITSPRTHNHLAAPPLSLSDRDSLLPSSCIGSSTLAPHHNTNLDDTRNTPSSTMTTTSPECGRAGISNTYMTSPSGRDATTAVAATAATVSPCGVLSPASAQSAASTSGTAVGHGHHLYGRPRSITARSPALSPAMDEFIGSRRGSKDSSDSATGTFLDDLVNQLTTPDYDNPHDQIARTNVFLMIYRKFLRPRDLLEMFIDRFEEQGDYVDADLDEQDLASLEARDTRLRICTCLHQWLKHYPNDFVHPQTRQRLAAFLRERVALFPYLQDIYTSLLPLSSIHYFNAWRAHNESSATTESGATAIHTAGSPIPSSNSSVSGDGDQERPVTPVPAMSYEEMDEDREWGLYDTDEELPEVRFAQQQGLANPLIPGTLTIPDSGSFASASSMDSLAPFPLISNSGRRNSRTLAHLPRDRRSSTGSLSHGCTNSTIRESILGARRGSASSASSHPGCYHHYQPSSGSFAEGDSTPMQLQPIGAIPIITKRSSSQAYRQRALSNASTGSTQTTGQAPSVSGTTANNGSTSGLHSCHKTPSLNSVGPGLFEGLLPHIIHPSPPPQPSANVTSTPFMDISDEDVADQLTCVEFGLFRKLKPRDMLRQVWKSGKGSVAFQACIAHFNFISSWVGTMILAPPKVKHRARMMEKFISIAKILRKKGNYNTTMAIVGAMNTSSIHRLVQTREMLQNKEIWTTFKELEKLMSSERSFAEYRAALKATKPPCIPYLGVHLGDLLSISEGNKDFRQDGSIHWQKFVLMSDVIMKVMEFQKVSYEIEPDPFISRIITDTHVLDDEELYTKSVDTEPNKLNHSRSLSFKLFL